MRQQADTPQQTGRQHGQIEQGLACSQCRCRTQQNSWSSTTGSDMLVADVFEDFTIGNIRGAGGFTRQASNAFGRIEVGP